MRTLREGGWVAVARVEGRIGMQVWHDGQSLEVASDADEAGDARAYLEQATS